MAEVKHTVTVTRQDGEWQCLKCAVHDGIAMYATSAAYPSGATQMLTHLQHHLDAGHVVPANVTGAL